MNLEDFLDNTFNGNDPADLKTVIDFLENEENLGKLFQFWNSLESSKITGQDEIFQRIIEEVGKQMSLSVSGMNTSSYLNKN